MKRIGAVILAAGASNRLQEPKQLVCLGEENLLERSLRVASEAGFSPVVIVLGASAKLIRANCKLAGSHIVVNEGWTEGMASSIRLGVESLRGVEGVVIMSCDMPGVTASHLVSLTTVGDVTASSYGGRRGVPAYFPKSAFAALMKLRGDSGARDLVQTARSVELQDGELDIDTIKDVAVARQLFG